MEEETVLEQELAVATSGSKNPRTAEFAHDVARYFKAFLETDLRGRLEPARRLRVERVNGLSTQLYLNKYSQLNKNLYKNFTSGFAQEAFVISQNKYVTHSDDRLSDQFARAIENLESDQINQLNKSFARAIDKCRSGHAQNYDAYYTEAIEAVKDRFAADLVVPMLRGGQNKPVDAEVGNMPLQIDASEKVYGSFAPAIETIVERYFTDKQSPDELLTALRDAVNLSAVRLVLREFLHSLSIIDAYQEVYQLHRNTQALGDHDMYLYFCELHIGSLRFPLFYTKVQSAHTYPSVTFSFDNRIFVNTKALNYVRKEYNRLMQLDITFEQEIPPVIYIDERKRKDVMPQLQQILDVLAHAFGLDKSLRLDTTSEQVSGTTGVMLTNRLQFAIFARANDSIVQDYEELLTPGSKAGEAFKELVEDFVLKTPPRYVQEVAEEWEEKSINDKLLSANPLPLNDEQKQAMMALTKQDSKVVVVNGASGTGKSHLVSGIVAQSFLDGYTTLVLSDTPAVLDTIETTITGMLKDVRGEKASFHNPLLYLGKTSEDFLEDIEGQFLDDLKNYHALYTKLQNELRTAKNRKIQDIAEQLTALSQAAENVNLHEVEQLVNNEAKFGGRDWIQDEPIEQINSDLQKLHHAIQYIRKSEANYLLPYIESSQQKIIAEFITIIREYEKANKNVNQRLPEFIVRYRKLLPDQKNDLQSALSYIHSNYRQYTKILNEDAITARLEITDNTDFKSIAGKQQLMNRLIDLAGGARKILSNDKNQNTRILNELLTYETAPEDVVAAASNYIDQVVSLKSKIFGFSGRTLVIENLTKQLKKSIPQFSLPDPEKNMEDVQLIVDLTSHIIEQLAQFGLELDYWKEVLHILKTDTAHTRELQKIVSSLVKPAEYEFMANYRIYEADNLLANISLLQYASDMNEVFRENPNLSTLFGIKSIGQVLKQPEAYSGRFNKLATDLDDVKQLDECKKVIKQFLKTYPEASRRLGVNFVNGNLDIIDDTFALSSTEEIKEYLAFKKKEQDITSYFREMISDTYGRTMSDLEQMTAVQMSHSLDTNLIKYIETRANDFKAIKLALHTKQQLTPQLFSALQFAYPCVLADIREYGTYIPLKPEMFDVVIIDEASRVSVAEAMPALLRAKKIIVLGDDKQFGNAKAQAASTMLNEMFRSKMIASLSSALRDVPADTKNTFLAKARDNFDVRNSILKFCRFIANNEITLTKYFRSAPELISYNDKKFYAGSLKCLKARTLPLNESIKFDYVNDGNASPQGMHTNLSEAKHILAALTDMKEAGYEGTIGIITPHFEQAVLIQAQIDEAVINDWFEKRKLKVMTFDTCQGEVRDYIFYSMVASKQLDRQSYLFPAEVSDKHHGAAEQRLAVGMSRAGSVMHFVLSQPIDAFHGEVKNLLQFYQSKLTAGNAKTSGNTTDILLAGESLLPQYFYATKFYKKFTDRTRLITQFSLGDLLKPLAPRYRHPSYKVDFLISFGDQRIVITYDEFRENFLATEVGAKDASTYLTPTDIYNQKVLESYGYKFLRLNKFNLGAKPVETLDKLLTEVTKKSSWPKDNGFIVK